VRRLLLALAALLLLTPAPAHAADGVPRTYDEALAHFAAAKPGVKQLDRFVLPSGNIYCAIGVRGLPPSCEIADGAVRDRRACAGNPFSSYVGRIELRRKPVAVCNTDTIRSPGARTLRYGRVAQLADGRVACLSERIGVTCISLKRETGFFLHRGEYVLFS
jgi:hypothetical protein